MFFSFVSVVDRLKFELRMNEVNGIFDSDAVLKNSWRLLMGTVCAAYERGGSRWKL